MKKEYKAPFVVMRELDTEETIAAVSLNLNDEGGTANFSDDDATGDGLSRRNSIWEGEE